MDLIDKAQLDYTNYEDLETMMIAVGLWLLGDRDRKFEDLDDMFAASLSIRIETKLAERYGDIH
jgi:hypothetical protein